MSWEQTVNLGNPQLDHQQIEVLRSHAAGQGMTLHVQPLPTGGFQCRAIPPQQQQKLGGTMLMAGMPAGGPHAYAQQQAQQQQAHGGYGAPQGQGGYGAPQAHGGYGAPQGQGGYGAPQGQAGYGAPQGQGGYGAPQGQGGYGAPQGQGGYGAPQVPPQAYASAPVAPPQGYGPQAYGAPPQQSYASAPAAGSYAAAGAGAGAYAMSGAASTAGAEAAPPMSLERVTYLRKVYGLLLGCVVFAIGAGMAAIYAGPTEVIKRVDGPPVETSLFIATMLTHPQYLGALFACLFVSTFVAGWVSKIPVVNVVALFGVSALMGVQLGPMIFVATYSAHLGETLSANPVRDTFSMVFAIFAGITSYVFITKKDFSYLRATLFMGVWVVFAACILGIFLHSEVFSLAIASVGALLAAGFLLYQTSYIFRNSEMDDAVGDALVLIVQLRNLFMFLLRIFMSRR